MNNETTNLPPSYREILRGIGEQLNLRKGAILKRVLLITWPVLLLIAIGYIVEKVKGFQTFTETEMIGAFVFFVVYVALTFIYTVIIKFLFEIEKRIWIDSYFDKRNLALEESWGIAKKLFWKALKFRLQVTFEYYFVPLLLGLVVTAGIIFAITRLEDDSGITLAASFIVFIIFSVCFVWYVYYVNARLRYLWFIFLDKYGTEYSYKLAKEEMERLNEISKTETFRKSLMMNLSTDIVDYLFRMVLAEISRGLASFGKFGTTLGIATRAYGEELSRQVTDIANITSQYILYRFARKEAYGEEQQVNENLYNLK